MAVPLSVFISYRNTKLGRLVANQLFQELEKRNFKPYWDKDFIEAGMKWDEEIYNNVQDSEVLIVLLEDEVSTSDWVQREVDMARATHIQILPLMLESKDPDAILKKLNINNYQYLLYDVGFDYDRLCSRVIELAEITRQSQQNRIDALEEKWKKKAATSNLNYASYRLRNSDHPIQLHLATGSLQEFKNVDVLVNSENDHLQMSRIHENHTVSSILRYSGSLVSPSSRRILEDTVQWELDTQADAQEEGRPVAIGMVFPTNAGHPKSALRQKNKVRYIFHVVTVSVFAKNRKRTMIAVETDEEIRECVTNCLDQVEKVNSVSGMISPQQLIMYKERRPYLEELENANIYHPITSIAFPIFGTGHAGRRIKDVIVPMLEAIRNYLNSHADTTLEKIYICAYSEDDILPVRDAMNVIFEPVS